MSERYQIIVHDKRLPIGEEDNLLHYVIMTSSNGIDM